MAAAVLARLAWKKFLWPPAEDVRPFVRLCWFVCAVPVWNECSSQSGTEAHAASTCPEAPRLITMINRGPPDTPRWSALRCGKRERLKRRAAMVRTREWPTHRWPEGRFLFPGHLVLFGKMTFRFRAIS